MASGSFRPEPDNKVPVLSGESVKEFKTYERFPRLRCPVMIVPARPPEPLSQPEREYLASKEAGIAIARESIQRLQVHWMEDTIHDIPLQRPAELASLLVEFVASVKRVV